MLYMILILTFCDFHLQDLALVTDQHDDKLQWTTDISGKRKSDNWNMTRPPHLNPLNVGKPQHIKHEFTFTHLTCYCWTWQMSILSWSIKTHFLAMPTVFNCWWLIWHSTDTCFMCRGNMPCTTKLTNELYCNCLAAGGQDKSSIKKHMCHTWITCLSLPALLEALQQKSWTHVAQIYWCMLNWNSETHRLTCHPSWDCFCNILRFWHHDGQLCCKKGTATATHLGHMMDSCVARKVPQLQPTLDIWPTAVLQKGIATDTHSDFLRFFWTKKWLFEIFWGRFWLYFEIFWGRFWLFEIFWDFSGCLHYCCLVDPSDFLRFFEADSDFLRFFLARYLSL